jgi:hypothetical protein
MAGEGTSVLSELTVIGRGLGSLNAGEVMAKMFFDPKHFARKTGGRKASC